MPPVRASPMNARGGEPAEVAGVERGVGRDDDHARAVGVVRTAARRSNEYRASSLPTGTPAICRTPPKFVCTSAPTV